MNSYFTFIILSILLPIMALAGIVYVPGDQPIIQAGINAAVNGDTVLVADSAYYENINFLGKVITVASYFLVDSDSVHIDSTIINGSEPSHPDSGSVVSFTSGEDTTSVIYGFTITGGTGTLYDPIFKVGGGIYCKYSGARIVHNKIVYNSVTYTQRCIGGGIGSFPSQSLKHVIIEENVIESNSLYAQDGSSGGGIFIPQGRIIKNKINHNINSGGVSSAGLGGGIALHCDTTIARTMVKIIGNTIAYNQATSSSASYGGIGGGIDIQFCNVLLVDNQITNNTVSGAQPEGGAGVRLIFSTGSSLVKDNTISFNSAFNPTSGLWGMGGGIRAWETVDLIIQDNQFEGNESAGGGGVATYSTKGTVISGNTFLNNRCVAGGGIWDEQTVGSIISGNTINRNKANYHGGGIMIIECSPKVYNNLIVNNKAVFNGGGIYVGDQNSEAQIINNTIVADTAGVYGGGICSNSVSPVVMNTIIWGNFAPSGEQIYTIGGNTQVVYCDVQDTIWPGTENIDADPQFISDDSLFHLTPDPSNPCVNTGADSIQISGQWYYCPTYDYEGDERPYMGRQSDMGADETQVPYGIELQPVAKIPKSFALEQNYPNPFNPSTTIEFALRQSGFVTLKIYNVLGEEVAILVSEKLTAGKFKYEWDAKELSSGFYFYKLEASNFILTRKMLLIR
jgi:hypothetical protein